MRNLGKKIKSLIAAVDRTTQRHRTARYLRLAYLRFQEIAVMEASAAASYYMLLAVFPTLIFLVSLFSILDRGQTQDYLSKLAFQGLIPTEAFNVLAGILQEIKHSSRSYSVLSLSVLGVLWTAAKGLGALLNSMNRIYRRRHLKNAYIRQLMSSLLIFLFAFMMILGLFLSVISDRVFEWLGNHLQLPSTEGQILLRIGSRHATAFLALLLVFSSMYYFVSGRLGRFQEALRGGLFTSLAWMIFPFLFSLYINSNKSFSFLYGSVAGMIILLLWIYFSCTMVLIGAFIHTEAVRRALDDGRIFVREKACKLRCKEKHAYRQYCQTLRRECE